MSLRVGDHIEITVDRMAIGGRGVGRFDGRVVFVADVAPQDTVRARITLIKKKFAEADCVEVLKPGPSRVAPPCPYAGECGGCSWQQISYSEQLLQKQAMVQDAFRKFSGFTSFDVRPVIPSPQEFRYRNRVQVHLAPNQLGFFKKRSHQIIDIQDCLITDQQLTGQFAELRAAKPQQNRIELLLTQTGQVVRSSNPRFEDELGFSQVNTGQNENLIRYVLRESEVLQLHPKRIHDLYAGAGNFTFPLAGKFSETPVSAVESHPKSVEFARKKITSGNLEFHEVRVERYLKTLKSLQTDLILLDPPRAGVGTEVMTQISQLDPLALIYISCHPVTLARDLQALKGYELVSVQPFDMFPQTDHVETVVVLKKSSQ